MSGFSHTPSSTVSSGSYVGISPHAVDYRSDWPAAEAVECHIEFLVHDQVTIIFVVSVGLSVCLFVCLCRVFLSRL